MDGAFEEHVASVLGEQVYEDWLSNPANGRDYQEFLAAWELVKCAHKADPARAEAATILLPESLQAMLSEETKDWLEEHGGEYKLELAAATVDAFFDASLEPVIVASQQMLDSVDGCVHRIVLVGGLAASPYVVAKLRAALQRWDRQLLAPDYGYAAVLEGAALYARYPAAISARWSALTYGIRHALRWTEGAPTKEWSETRQCYFTSKGFTPYVTRGQLIRCGSTVAHTFNPQEANQAAVAFEIHGSTTQAPQYTTDQGMHQITTVTVDLDMDRDDSPDGYYLTALLQFGEALIHVKVVNERTGREHTSRLTFDGVELLPRNSGLGPQAAQDV